MRRFTALVFGSLCAFAIAGAPTSVASRRSGDRAQPRSSRDRRCSAAESRSHPAPDRLRCLLLADLRGPQLAGEIQRHAEHGRHDRPAGRADAERVGNLEGIDRGLQGRRVGAVAMGRAQPDRAARVRDPDRPRTAARSCRTSPRSRTCCFPRPSRSDRPADRSERAVRPVRDLAQQIDVRLHRRQRAL